MILLIAETIAVGCAILGLHALRGRLGLALLFVFVGANQFLQNVLAATVYLEVLDRYPVSPGSAVLFSSSLFAILLVYIKDDVPATRRLIYGIVLANVSLAAIALSTRWGLAAGVLSSTGSAAEWFPFYTIGAFALGTALLIMDVFLVIVVYEILAARVPWVGLWGQVVLALGVVLATDSLVFASVVFRGLPDAGDLVVGNMGGKLIAGFLYGSMLWAYLRFSGEGRQSEPEELRDPFTIFTYRERYQRLAAEKVELERAHEKERRRAQIALEGAQLGLWDWNIQEGSTYLDDRWAEMLGYRREEISPQIGSWETRIHPEDRARVREVLNAHLEGRLPFYDVEHRLRTKSGEWRWIQSLGKVLEWDADGKPLRMSGTHVDIEDRKVAEEKLEQAERRYRELFEKAPLMYVTTGDIDGVPFIKDCNSAFLERLGYEQGEAIGHPLGDFYAEDSRGALLGEDGYQASLAGQEVARERQLLTKSGEKVSTLLRAQPEHDAAGVVSGTRAMFVDISEHKWAEEALSRSERRLAEAQKIAKVGSWEKSYETGVLSWSAEHYAILGLDPETVTPSLEGFIARIHPDDRATVLGREGTLTEPEPSSLEFRVVHDDGEVRMIHAETRLEEDAAGNRLRWHGILQDITEQKAAEEELRSSREQLRRLAAGVEAARESERTAIAREIHDEFGQALTGLRMDLSAMRPELSSQDGARRLEGMMELIDQTIDSVRDLSSRLRPSVLDDLGLCEAIEWQASDFARRSGVDCRLHLEADCEGAEGKVSLSVFRILQEALTNVARHAEASTVDISLHREYSSLVLIVEDNGKGISPEDLEAGDSLGFVGMRERALDLGGVLTVERAGEAGTIVSLRVPL